VDYTVLYRRQLSERDLREVSRTWSLFVSAYNASERVRASFEVVEATRKHWLLHPEYRFLEAEKPLGEVFSPESFDEADFWRHYVTAADPDLTRDDICIDLTGFMRPHLMFFARLLFDAGAKRFTALYTDPVRYVKEENTEFSKGPVVGVRQVAGFEGLHVPDLRHDLMVIGTGFDHELIRRVAESKLNAKKLQLFGLPSLQPEMYQQGVMRAAKAAEAVGGGSDADTLFAPANDPFVTAQVLHDKINAERSRTGITNLYLASLGTKPQALGFALLYLTELRDSPASMVFPYSQSYERETTKGVARTWMYEVELLKGN
jgi:hypothetical protein